MSIDLTGPSTQKLEILGKVLCAFEVANGGSYVVDDGPHKLPSWQIPDVVVDCPQKLPGRQIPDVVVDRPHKLPSWQIPDVVVDCPQKLLGRHKVMS